MGRLFYQPAAIDRSQRGDPSAHLSPAHTFTEASGDTRFIWTTFSADQIDLNFTNPEVLFSMMGVLLDYLAKGADYIRLDAVGYIWKTPGTSFIHLEKPICW